MQMVFPSYANLCWRRSKA